jgi:VanZ family protein
MTPRFIRIRRWAAVFGAVGWTALIPLLSLLPPSFFATAAPLEKYSGLDKVVHAVLYAVQAGLLIAAWRSFRSGPRFLVWACAGAATAYGVLMEILQRICTDCRQFSWGDMLANAVGAAIMAGLFIGWTALLEHRHSARRAA